MTTLMNKQATTGHWKIMADYPSRDGTYVVVFRLDDGGNPAEPEADIQFT